MHIDALTYMLIMFPILAYEAISGRQKYFARVVLGAISLSLLSRLGDFGEIIGSILFDIGYYLFAVMILLRFHYFFYVKQKNKSQTKEDDEQ